MAVRWRRWALALGAGLAVVALAIALWVVWLFRQATALPEWYDPRAEGPEDPASAPAGWVIVPDAVEGVADPPASSPSPTSARRELRGFHLRSAAAHPATRRAIRASRATLEEGRLEAGVVIDVSKISLEDLAPADREFYERALASFPALRDRELYVGIEDVPITRDGYLALGDDPRVRIGELEYSLRGAAAKLGLSAARIRRQIDTELVRLKVTAPAF